MCDLILLKKRLAKVERKKNSTTLRLLVRSIIALLLLLVIVILPFFIQKSPIKVSLGDRLKPPGSKMIDGSIALLGTDQLGRDILVRILYGGRISILISVGAIAVAGLLGTILGLISGYFGGKVDEILMRLGDIQLAFPAILLALAITAVLGSSIPNLIVTLGITRWVGYARVIRGNVISVREEDYVTSAVSLGIPNYQIMLRHILPNVITPGIILAALHLGQMIIQESALSFLGLGIQPPTPSWGGMIGDGREYMNVGWWISTFPGLAIAGSVIVFGYLGDAVRDVLDPKFRDSAL